MSAEIYIGTAKCGCIRLAFHDDPLAPGRVAERVAAAAKDGLALERHPVEVLREREWECPAHRRRAA